MHEHVSNPFEQMKRQLFDALEKDRSSIEGNIQDAGDAQIDIKHACSKELVEIIERVFAEHQTYLENHLRTWCREKIQCNIEQKNGMIFFTWSDPTLFRDPNAPKPRYGDEV